MVLVGSFLCDSVSSSNGLKLLQERFGCKFLHGKGFKELEQAAQGCGGVPNLWNCSNNLWPWHMRTCGHRDGDG